MRIEQATIKDIAQELNISISTVSRALKDYPRISSNTKKKVKEVAERLNYRPNAVALSLRKSRSFTIGVIIPDVVHFFFSTVISGIEEVASSRGYNVILTQTNERFEREKSNINTMLGNQIDGFMISFSKETKDFEHFTKLLDRNYPIVFFDRVPDIENAVNVVVDDYQGAYDATTHLISQGYKKIIHLAGPKNLKICFERERGYRDALSAHGITIDESLILECPLGVPEESKKIVYDLFQELEIKPDAVFANNDMVAVGAMMACRELGFQIPKDIGIVGFSNWQICSILEPSLTSVYQPGFDIGVKATEILLDLIENKTSIDQIASPIVLKTELMIRNSSKRLF
ncbi:LacI family DNA-binding transcriptional regulator [Algoriphagus lutimaris]|uniref:LacI family DNA-binding transcriptional regulator n=1 Tax=Algoriphagus lutimaris TaxID=613197 RepID=UPI00196ACF9B|nr:LacI family DNA-binding transcriptional regulator [Algoriphagus lutimaris]MBN3519661.1 LacI family DNA-binding transcriptional regulator [Algoriphagus lutimaris]